MVAGVGFTVALFVTRLSFDSAQLSDAAKIGILVGSTIAGTVGYLILRSAGGPTEDDRQLLPEPA
jgi:Na+/H+ antiporter NhaA